MSEKMHEVKNETDDELSDIVELTDDAGKVLKFYHIGTLDYKNEWYAFFQPAEEMEGADPDEVVIFLISGDEGNEVLLPVKDEKLLDEVYKEYVKEMEDSDENCEDCEDCGSCKGCEDCDSKNN